MSCRTTIASAGLCLGLLSACTTVGPDYAPPEMPTGGEWMEDAAAGDVTASWWRQFDDPVLSELVEEALNASPTMAEATARLAEARAGRDAIAGRSLPQLRASASATENRISEEGAIPVGQIPGFDPEYSLFDAGFDASWEIDLWGRTSRQIEAAQALAGAAEQGYLAARIRMAAEVARNYFALRGAQAERAASEDIAAADASIAELTALLAKAGLVTTDNSDRASAMARTSGAALNRAQAEADGAAFALAALLGKRPEQVVARLQKAAPVPEAPDIVRAGLRSELLRRRPDIRQAERELAAATADVGVAIADLFPRFSLLGGVGTQARAADSLGSGDTLRFQVGPSFSWPIFSGGAIRAQIRAADARADAAAARYEQAVAGALNDSEAAINRLSAARAARQQADEAARDLERAYNLANARFRAGQDSRIQMQQARKQWAEAMRARASARTAEAQAAATLYKALGAPTDFSPPAP